MAVARGLAVVSVAGLLDHALALFLALLAQLGAQLLAAAPGRLDHLGGLLARLVSSLARLLQPLLGLLPGLFGSLHLLRDLALAPFRGSDDPGIDPDPQHDHHHDEGDDLGQEAEREVEQARFGEIHGTQPPTPAATETMK